MPPVDLPPVSVWAAFPLLSSSINPSARIHRTERAAIDLASVLDRGAFDLQRALDNGVTQEEIGELITHLAFYSGWPTAMTAATIANEVFESRE